MGLFNLYKPKEYKYRYIYYDPKKEASKEREKKMEESKTNADGTYKPTILKRGAFREMANQNKSIRREQARSSNIRIFIILALLLAITYFLIK
ncbi:hypothetical protein SDC9_162395 [bioreactor metagenome]|jgi:hypothetical protein|uniref:Riboflavin synthase subunit beta n=1 Tax=bioreactor metagenome TaxID=1076179 RepID=A0A645FN14_9ZZZZ|nr:hypothetical protein [Paludibacter sp.]